MFAQEAESILALSGLALYITIFALPFIQEDVAVIAAATASLTGAGDVGVLFVIIILGLTASDAWKYWVGWFARRHSWAHKFAEKPGVSVAGELVKKEIYKTLLAARFVPGTRIPTYVACGFFESPYMRFVLMVMSTAVFYVVIMFSLFHFVGEVAGEQAKIALPLIAVGLIAAYILSRWLRHRGNKLGPMTPLSDDFDNVLPPSDDAASRQQ